MPAPTMPNAKTVKAKRPAIGRNASAVRHAMGIRDDLLMQRGPEARDDWIRVQNKNAQRRLHPYVLTASGCPRSVELPQQAIPPTVFQNWPTASDFARFIELALPAPSVMPLSNLRNKTWREELHRG
jgi:hypothetical protein